MFGVPIFVLRGELLWGNERIRWRWAARARGEGKWPKGRYTQRMHRTLRMPWARELYGHRKTQGERPFAEIKAAMRFRRFALRGLVKVRGEWDLVCAALNLRRMMQLRDAAT